VDPDNGNKCQNGDDYHQFNQSEPAATGAAMSRKLHLFISESVLKQFIIFNAPEIDLVRQAQSAAAKKGATVE
jgi:hypothetical protein